MTQKLCGKIPTGNNIWSTSNDVGLNLYGALYGM